MRSRHERRSGCSEGCLIAGDVTLAQYSQSLLQIGTQILDVF